MKYQINQIANTIDEVTPEVVPEEDFVGDDKHDEHVDPEVTAQGIEDVKEYFEEVKKELKEMIKGNDYADLLRRVEALELQNKFLVKMAGVS